MTNNVHFLIILCLSVVFVTYFCKSNFLSTLNPVSFTKSFENIETWLKDNNLSEFIQLFKDNGISQLSQCGQLGELPELPSQDEQRLQKAASLLQQRLILRQWLVKNNLQQYHPRLLNLEVASLEDVYWLEDSKAKPALQKDFPAWSAARQQLPISKQRLDALKSDLWSEVVKTSNHQDAWTWGGMLVVSVSMAGLVTLAAITQPSLAPEAKHSLLQYVTGKYLLPSNCKVIFNWADPHPVGQTVCFIVHFYQRNGQPYPICDTDQLAVEVSEGSRKLAIITDLGGQPSDPATSNQARITFTVRHAGHYRITITVSGQHVAGSPFTRAFTAGPPHAQRTAVLRHCSTVVCTACVSHVLCVEPRDEYGNVCCGGATSAGTSPGEGGTSVDDPTKGYTVELKQLGNNNHHNQRSSPTQDNKDVLSGDNNIEPFEASSTYTVTLDYDWQSRKVTIQLKFIYEGCYHASVKYNNVELHNGNFDIIVLNSVDSTLVRKNIASKNHNVCYEAKLIGLNGEKMAKPKRVLCYVSPKQVIIKELLLKFIPKRLFTFRLCPSTKFNFLPNDCLKTENWTGIFTIEDGAQPKLELYSKERNVIAATFAQFLLKNMGGSETFKDKQDFFYHEVRKYHQKHYHEKLPIKINREKLLESSMKATKNFSVSDWCRNFEITFQGEEGIDWGGLRREWFEIICGQLFDPKYGLFRTFHDGQQSLVHPNGSQLRPSHLKLRHFEFAGRIVGKCLYESALGGNYRQLVRARFSRSFLAQVIGLRVHYKYFEQDDPDLYLSKIKYLVDNDLDQIDNTELHFVEEQYDNDSGQLVKVIELLPNGAKIKVTNATKLQYLDALAQYRLATSIKDELEAFLKGLNELIPDNLLSIFDENELELLLCGTGQYSIADFKQHHVVNGSSAEFRRVVGWFWAAVSNFTQEEMARLLQFTTGCSQLPPAGFKELSPRFQITAAPTFGNLPTAHTCFNQLCLPDYDRYEHFEKSLLIAISEGTEGFGMV